MEGNNSFFNAGPTWSDAFGGLYRLDYLLLSRSLRGCVTECYVDRHLDLATAARDDHFASVKSR